MTNLSGAPLSIMPQARPFTHGTAQPSPDRMMASIVAEDAGYECALSVASLSMPLPNDRSSPPLMRAAATKASRPEVVPRSLMITRPASRGSHRSFHEVG